MLTEAENAARQSRGTGEQSFQNSREGQQQSGWLKYLKGK
jgi:hypothetical protein